MAPVKYLPEIKGIQENTLIDWEGRVAAVVFLAGCNFRCPYCHASYLVLNPGALESIPVEGLNDMLSRNPGWIDGVVISGGEPTLDPALPALIRHLRSLDMQIKLNTNGTNPDVLQELLDEELLEAIAMDVKGPLDGRYERCAGRMADLDAIERSIEIIIDSNIEYEFCTTVCPPLMSEGDVIDTARELRGAKKYFLQRFRANGCIDPSLLDVKPYSPDEMRRMAEKASKYVGQCLVRGDHEANAAR